MARSQGSERLFTFGISALVGLAFALRVSNLGTQDLWGDEAFSVWLARRSPLTIFGDLASGEPHPPLYPMLLWLWVRAVGYGEFALRFLSLLFGVTIVPLVAIVGRRLAGRRLGLVAAFLAAVNPFLIWYSQENRMYVVAAAGAVWCAASYLRLQDGNRSWLSFGLAAGILAYTHYYGLLVVAAFGLIAVVDVLRSSLKSSTLLLACATFVALYLPWVLYASRIFFGYYGVAPGRVDLEAVFSSFWLRTSLGWAIQTSEALLWLPLFLAVAALGLIAAWRHCSPGTGYGANGTVLLLSWLLVPLVGGYAISLVRPMYAERYLIVATPAFLLLIAWGVVFAMRWRVAGLAALGLLVLAMYGPLHDQYFDRRYVKSEYSQHTRQLAELGRDDDAVILNAPSQGFLFNYYYDGALPHYPLPRDVPLAEEDTARELSELAGRHSGLWLFLYATHDYDPGDFVEKWLSNNAYRAWHSWTINGQLAYYATYADTQFSVQPGTARFGGKLELRRFATAVRGYEAGEVVPLRLKWRAIKPTEQPLKLSVRLRDDSGFLWGQTDVEPVSGFRPTQLWPVGDEVDDRLGLFILPGTPPGKYAIELRVYPAGGAPLGVEVDGLAASGPTVTLGTIEVVRPSGKTASTTIPAYRKLGMELGGQVVLEGGSAVGEVTAGQTAYLTALWRVARATQQDYLARLRLLDSSGTVASEMTVRPYNGDYVPSRWQPGEVLRWQYNVPIPPTLAAGEYGLTLALGSKGADGRPTGFADEVELRRIVVKSRPRPAAAGQPEVELDVSLSGKALLKGYRLETTKPLAAGKLTLVLYWTPVQQFNTPYTVFTHLLDAQQRVLAQLDSQPCGGGCPTTSWLPGDIIEDRYEIPINADTPPGEYELEIGMYDAATGARLNAFDRGGRPIGDRVLLPSVTVTVP